MPQNSSRFMPGPVMERGNGIMRIRVFGGRRHRFSQKTKSMELVSCIWESFPNLTTARRGILRGGRDVVAELYGKRSLVEAV